MDSKVSEKDMREVYFQAFGKEYDSADRKQAPLPLEIAYIIALKKLKREGKYAGGGEITNDTYYESVNHFIYFCMNYPRNFLDAFGSLKNHLSNKFNNYYNKYGTYGVMIQFYAELDSENRRILTDYSLKNYKGTPIDSDVSEVEYFNSVNHFIFFCFNFPSNFMDAFSSHLKVHLSSKWTNAYEKKGSVGAMIYFWSELDNQNRKKLADWVRVNYTGTKLYEVGGALGDVAGMLPSPLPMSTIQAMADGGSIENNYKDKTEQDIWNNIWNYDQKFHFLSDHVNEIGFDEEFYNQRPKSTKRIQGSNGAEIGFRFIDKDKIIDTKYVDLPRYVKHSLQKHIRGGQYADGGNVGKLNTLQKRVYESVKNRSSKSITTYNLPNDTRKILEELYYMDLLNRSYIKDTQEAEYTLKFANGGGVESKAEKLANMIREDYQNGVKVQVNNDYGDSADFSIYAPFEYSFSKERAKEINKKYFNGEGTISGGGNEHYLDVNFDLDKFANGGGIENEILNTIKSLNGYWESYYKGVMSGKKDDGYVTIKNEEDLSNYINQKTGYIIKNIEVIEKGKTYPYNRSNPYYEDTYLVTLKNGTTFKVERSYGRPNWSGNVDYKEQIKISDINIKYADGGGVKSDYYILEGVDNLNGKPLYRVESTSESDNEYVGEWHTDKSDAEKELNSLSNKPTQSLGVVKVIFENPEHNYTTNVGVNVTEEEARKYFVGKMFDVGTYAKENMQKVIDIEFSKSKEKYADGGGVKLNNLFDENELINLIKTYDFKTADVSNLERITYSESENPFKLNDNVWIQISPKDDWYGSLIIVIEKVKNHYEIRIGKDTGWTGGLEIDSTEFAFDIPKLTFEEFKKGFLNATINQNYCLYSKDSKKIHLIGSLQEIKDYALQNGYELEEYGNIIVLRSKNLSEYDDEHTLLVSVLSSTQIQNLQNNYKNGGGVDNHFLSDSEIDKLNKLEVFTYLTKIDPLGNFNVTRATTKSLREVAKKITHNKKSFSDGGGVDVDILVGQVYLNTTNNSYIIIDKVEDSKEAYPSVYYHTYNQPQSYRNSNIDRISFFKYLVDSGGFVLQSDKMENGGGVGNDNFYVKSNFGHWSVIDKKNNKMVVGYSKKEDAIITSKGLNSIDNLDELNETIIKLKTIKGYGYFIDKAFADGGEIVDLFEDYENIPANVQEVLDRYSEKYGEDFGEMDYNDMAEMHKEIEKIGYTFDSGLDNMPYGLRPIGVELSQLRGYEEYGLGGFLFGAGLGAFGYKLYLDYKKNKGKKRLKDIIKDKANYYTKKVKSKIDSDDVFQEREERASRRKS